MSRTTSLAASIRDEKTRPSIADIEQSPIKEKRPDTIEPTAPAAVSPFHPSQFPEGGKDAYFCLLGGFCCLFCSFGWLNCLGVFQSYYQLNQLRDYSPSTIAWIASLEIFVMFAPGPIVGWVYDNYGPKYILLFGTVFHVLGLMMTSLCTEYWQFILAQGICSPLGLNCIFQAATSTIPTWFLKNRGLAYGIMAAGSGLGGIIFPIMASHLASTRYEYYQGSANILIVSTITLSHLALYTLEVREKYNGVFNFFIYVLQISYNFTMCTNCLGSIPEIGFGWTMRTFSFIVCNVPVRTVCESDTDFVRHHLDSRPVYRCHLHGQISLSTQAATLPVEDIRGAI
jgi:MFS family permease